MKANFDKAASNYDTAFTHTIIGQLQRCLVYEHFLTILEKKAVQNILEINCGTGEDAIWLAKQNYYVTATDISSEMIALAKNKSDLENVNFEQLDINKLDEHFSDKKFDLIFSDFGGLNCLSKTELESFFTNALDLLTDEGQLVLVIMPKNTLWERFYFLSKFRIKQAFRRHNQSVMANVEGIKIKTFYHNPDELIKLTQETFNLKELKPIGFFIPPSYLETYFKHKPIWISVLNSLENKIKNRSFLAKYSDHYLIVMQKK